jgi:myo-inositol 2-dehydrogenase/D-chiro-inositol 1-dehydrogenase
MQNPSHPGTSKSPLRVAVAGLGRMGMIHAHHMLELSRETGQCELVAVATANPEEAERLKQQTGAAPRVFSSVADLAEARVCDAVVVATNTSSHQEHGTLLLETGHRLFMEKPLTGTLAGDREFSSWLDQRHPQGIMLGFQRRFDAPLLFAKALLDEDRIGRLFRIYSALEDSAPAPNGFNSPGILPDMGIHNIDEILWLSGRRPQKVLMFGSNIQSHRLTTCNEDFDDALLLMHFSTEPGSELFGEIEVSRNHVAGYRGETILYGDRGQIHLGRFYGDPREVLVEVYGVRGEIPAVVQRFATRAYGSELPEFVDRFGAAYKEELRVFIECCRTRSPFPVTHLEALAAQEVVDAAMKKIFTIKDMTSVAYSI